MRYIFAHEFLEDLRLCISNIFKYTPYKVLIAIFDVNIFSQSNVIHLILVCYVTCVSFVMALISLKTENYFSKHLIKIKFDS